MTVTRSRRLVRALLVSAAAIAALTVAGVAPAAPTLALWSRSAPVPGVAFGSAAPSAP